jgi:hypothetical protein
MKLHRELVAATACILVVIAGVTIAADVPNPRVCVDWNRQGHCTEWKDER